MNSLEKNKCGAAVWCGAERGCGCVVLLCTFGTPEGVPDVGSIATRE